MSAATVAPPATDPALPAGFVESELGLLPQNWTVEQCRELCLKIQDGTHFSPKVTGGDYLYVTSRNIGCGTLDVSNADTINETEHRKIFARCDTKKGDLLLTKDGANTGNAAINDLEQEISLLSSVAFLRFKPKNDARYFLQYVLSHTGQERIKQLMSGNAITRLTLTKIRQFSMPRPPTEEQQSIAEALSDADALIGALDKIIAKKRAMKLGTAQQLLTGSTRLPGFGATAPARQQTLTGAIPTDWNYARLGDLTTRVGSGITPTGGERVYKLEGRPFVRSQNVGWGELRLDDLAFIDESTHASFAGSEIEELDVLLNITGASIGRSAVADHSVAHGNVNQHVCEIRTDQNKLDSRYLNQFLLSSAGQSQIDSFQAGGNRQGLNYSQIRSFQIPLPPTVDEQRAIAGVVSDMHAEIAALERRRDKTKDVKQGMMQALLKGRTRLV